MQISRSLVFGALTLALLAAPQPAAAEVPDGATLLRDAGLTSGRAA